jgi:hypothetical protein
MAMRRPLARRAVLRLETSRDAATSTVSPAVRERNARRCQESAGRRVGRRELEAGGASVRMRRKVKGVGESGSAQGQPIPGRRRGNPKCTPTIYSRIGAISGRRRACPSTNELHRPGTVPSCAENRSTGSYEYSYPYSSPRGKKCRYTGVCIVAF